MKEYFGRRGIELSSEQERRIIEIDAAYAAIGLDGFVPLLAQVLVSDLEAYFDEKLGTEIRGTADETPVGIRDHEDRRSVMFMRTPECVRNGEQA